MYSHGITEDPSHSRPIISAPSINDGVISKCRAHQNVDIIFPMFGEDAEPCQCWTSELSCQCCLKQTLISLPICSCHHFIFRLGFSTWPAFYETCRHFFCLLCWETDQGITNNTIWSMKFCFVSVDAAPTLAVILVWRQGLMLEKHKGFS
jgi:hypothetical protein